MLAEPASVPFSDRSSLLGSELVTWTFMPLNGEAPFRAMKVVFSKPLPTVAVPGTSPDGLTVTTRVVSWVGVLKPVVVVLALTVVVPWPAPTKLVVALAWPPVNVSGEELIVPAAVLLLVTLTDALAPPARGNVCTKFREESSCAGYTERGVCIPGFVVNVAVPIP
jgi:hypothetical protein